MQGQIHVAVLGRKKLYSWILAVCFSMIMELPFHFFPTYAIFSPWKKPGNDLFACKQASQACSDAREACSQACDLLESQCLFFIIHLDKITKIMYIYILIVLLCDGRNSVVFVLCVTFIEELVKRQAHYFLKLSRLDSRWLSLDPWRSILALVLKIKDQVEDWDSEETVNLL